MTSVLTSVGVSRRSTIDSGYSSHTTITTNERNRHCFLIGTGYINNINVKCLLHSVISDYTIHYYARNRENRMHLYLRVSTSARTDETMTGQEIRIP